MNKYLIVVVVSVLALTGCSNEEKNLEDCYSQSERIVKNQVDYWQGDESGDEIIERKRKTYGVSKYDGKINHAGRMRCKRLIELGVENY